MDKKTALRMLKEYSTVIGEFDSYELKEAAGMPDRWPPDGSEKKAMRWLGYMQGMLVGRLVYTLEEVKMHSKRGWVLTSPEDEQSGPVHTKWEYMWTHSRRHLNKLGKEGWELCGFKDCDFYLKRPLKASET